MEDYKKYLQKYQLPKEHQQATKKHSAPSIPKKTRNKPAESPTPARQSPNEPRNRVLEYHRISQYQSEHNAEPVLYAGSQGTSIMFRKKEAYKPAHDRTKWSV